jgi:hypothetical protein
MSYIDPGVKKLLRIFKNLKYSPMKYLFISCFLLVSLKLASQPCSEATLSQKPGIWKEGIKGSVSGIPAGDLDKEKKVVAALHNMIKSKYTPVGAEADFNGSYDSPDAEIPVNNYGYTIYFLNYICEGNLVKTVHETSTTFSIDANRFDGRIFEIPDENSIPDEGFFSIKIIPVEKDGYFYFEQDVSLGFGLTGKSRNWLITHDNKLPFAYVTKKEFLEKQKQMLLSSSAKSTGGSKKDYEKALTKLETLLTTATAESLQPVIVKKDPNDYLSYLFTTGNDPFGKVLIKPNPGYFNTKLSRSSPQFFVVNVKGNEKDAVAANFINGVMKDFDFAALRNMLGK